MSGTVRVCTVQGAVARCRGLDLGARTTPCTSAAKRARRVPKPGRLWRRCCIGIKHSQAVDAPAREEVGGGDTAARPEVNLFGTDGTDPHSVFIIFSSGGGGGGSSGGGSSGGVSVGGGGVWNDKRQVAALMHATLGLPSCSVTIIIIFAMIRVRAAQAFNGRAVLDVDIFGFESTSSATFQWAFRAAS